jgi:hypothetical protein
MGSAQELPGRMVHQTSKMNIGFLHHPLISGLIE